MNHLQNYLKTFAYANIATDCFSHTYLLVYLIFLLFHNSAKQKNIFINSKKYYLGYF